MATPYKRSDHGVELNSTQQRLGGRMHRVMLCQIYMFIDKHNLVILRVVLQPYYTDRVIKSRPYKGGYRYIMSKGTLSHRELYGSHSFSYAPVVKISPLHKPRLFDFCEKYNEEVPIVGLREAHERLVGPKYSI